MKNCRSLKFYLWSILTMVLAVSLVLSAMRTTQVKPDTPAAKPTYDQVQPLLKQFCYDCHGEKRQSGKFRLDKLNPDLAGGVDADRWHEVLNRINVGEMPPEKAVQPKAEEIERITSWLRSGLQKAAAAKKNSGRPILRRMTREEYNYTLQDLLDLPIEFTRELPADGATAKGFVNNGEVLGISPLHMEYYIKIARRALNTAIVTDGPPPVYHYHFDFGTDRRGFKLLPKKLPPTFQDAPDALKSETEERNWLPFGGIRRDEIGHGEGWIDVYPCQRPQVNHGVRSQRGPHAMFQIWMRKYPKRGRMRIRVKAASMAPEGKPDPHLAVCIARKAGNGIEFKQVGPAVIVDASPKSPKVYEFFGQLENMPIAPDDSDVTAVGRGNETILGLWNKYDRAPDEKEKKPQPHLRIFSVEFEGPWYEQWPPAYHNQLLKAEKAKTEKDIARTIISNFLLRAWRRPPHKNDVDRLVSRWQELRPGCKSFSASMQKVLLIPLVSPHFLLLPQQAEGNKSDVPLDNYELASRLSYFLWSSMPDQRLLELADSGELQEEQLLRREVRRMVQDKKTWRMIKAFTHQWLNLRRLDDVRIQRTNGFTVGMKQAMRQETEHFLGEVLLRDLSALNIIDSDFLMLNHYLAGFYGIEGVHHPDFRAVKINPKVKRGGLFGQGSILVAGSNGMESHPVKRGVWLLKQLLDDPPPPPPPNVPELDENDSREFRRSSFKKKLEIHRDKVACNSCHRKIDPWGIALEGYDFVGRWHSKRDRESRRIDDLAKLPDGTEINGVEGLKKYLLEKKRHQFARALVKMWLTYALNRSLTFADEKMISDHTANFEQNNYRLQALIGDIVVSEEFTRR